MDCNRWIYPCGAASESPKALPLDFRADAFNLFNTPNFATPTGILTDSNFGVSTQMLNGGLGGLNPLFQVGGQLALKLQF